MEPGEILVLKYGGVGVRRWCGWCVGMIEYRNDGTMRKNCRDKSHTNNRGSSIADATCPQNPELSANYTYPEEEILMNLRTGGSDYSKTPIIMVPPVPTKITINLEL